MGPKAIAPTGMPFTAPSIGRVPMTRRRFWRWRRRWIFWRVCCLEGFPPCGPPIVSSPSRRGRCFTIGWAPHSSRPKRWSAPWRPFCFRIPTRSIGSKSAFARGSRSRVGWREGSSEFPPTLTTIWGTTLHLWMHSSNSRNRPYGFFSWDGCAAFVWFTCGTNQSQ